MWTTGILGAGAAVLLWLVVVFNRLVRQRNQVANAFGQIDVQLKRRHDLVPNLVAVARRHLEHEAATLAAVIAARQQASRAEQAAATRLFDRDAMAALMGAEMMLSGSLGQFFAVVEGYPELKADQTMQMLSEELTSTENRLAFARQAYNDAVLEYNDAATQFPDLLVARLFGFGAQAMLASTEGEHERRAVGVAR